jgi:eukaryotic-like serine/threonine-protein kinase
VADRLPLVDGKYQLLRKLGEGGMGAVYEARNRATGRKVAVKMIAGEAALRGTDTLARFQREAMATAAIESQHIAHALDAGVDRATGGPYLVMDLLSGEDLASALARVGPLPTEVALRTVAQACLGLQKAHEAGVVHRDIKPANLFLARREGSEIVVKLLDFGIAKVTLDKLGASAGAMTTSGAILGSPVYMSPEQVVGKKTIDHRTDLWSLGVVLYEALSARTPHEADTVGGLIVAIAGEAPRPIRAHAPWVPAGVAAVVHKALARDPAARFSSAKEMFEAIRAFLPQGHALDASMFGPLSEHVPRVEGPPVALVGAQTNAGITRADLTTVSASRRWTPRAAWLAGLGGIVLVVVAGLAASRLGARAAASPAVPATGVAGSVAAPTMPATNAAAAVLAPEPTMQIDGTSEVGSPASPLATSPSTPARSTRQVRAHPGAAPATSPSATKPSHAPALTKPGCNPPYVLSADGVKTWKPECFN